MKTVITLAMGFWISRQLYIRFDKKQSRIQHAKVKKRLQQFLEANGFTADEAHEQSDDLLRI